MKRGSRAAAARSTSDGTAVLRAALDSIELSDQQRAALRAAVDERGVSVVAGEVGVSIISISRAVAGLPQHRGTKMLILRWLGAFDHALATLTAGVNQ